MKYLHKCDILISSSTEQINRKGSKTMKSKVMTIANALVKQGVSRSAAMVRTWITVKLRRIDTKTAGVTHGNRQQLLARLSRYSPEEITIKLRREQDNAVDRNALQVIAAVLGKGSAVMGYLNRQLAQLLRRSWTRARKLSARS